MKNCREKQKRLKFFLLKFLIFRDFSILENAPTNLQDFSGPVYEPLMPFFLAYRWHNSDKEL